MKRYIPYLYGALMMASLAPLKTSAQWIHTYGTESNLQVLHTQEIKDDGVTLSFPTTTDGIHESVCVQTDPTSEGHSLPISDIHHIQVGTNIPTIYMTMDDPVIADKVTEHPAIFSFDGQSAYPSIEEMEVSARGRGNSTMTLPKKPMRLKFNSKVSIAGLKKAKSYTLLANFLDETLSKNAIAMRLGQLLELPFTHHMIPVNVVVNDESWGQYNLTEKRGISGASVDIDEETGILFELAAKENADEKYFFISGPHDLAVMVSDPDFDELYEDAEKEEEGSGITPSERLSQWEEDFNRLTTILYSEDYPQNADIDELVDIESLAKWVLVHAVMCNQEPKHPKSCFLYKCSLSPDEKYHFGPLWDFDWSMGFQPCDSKLASPTNAPWLITTTTYGNDFFLRLIQSSQFKLKYREVWDDFYTNIYPKMLDYIDEYASLIAPSAWQNSLVWNTEKLEEFYDIDQFYKIAPTDRLEFKVNEMKDWWRERVEWMNSDPALGLCPTSVLTL